MADTITFLIADDDGDRILDELEQQADLEGEVGDATRTYELEGADQRSEILETLTDIDADWTEHLSEQV
jgi:hypothetical protein